MKFRLYNIDGWHCTGVEINGVLHIVRWIAPIGHCIRP